MRIGAVITAAGMSVRMGDFKQLMKVGSCSMVEHVVCQFENAEVDDIVVVTGCRADEVKAALSGHKIKFVHNADFETNQMLHSVKCGLQILKDSTDRVLICPCDVAAFKAETVRELMNASGKLVFPSYNGRTGHPICVDSGLIPDILEYEGGDGLRGAFNHLGIEPERIEVRDEGILMDADTMEDYKQMTMIK